MTTVDAKTVGYDVAWAERAAERASQANEAKWAEGRRKAATATMRALELPSPRNELWRRTDFRALEAALPELDPFVAGTRARTLDDLPSPILERLAAEGGNVAVLVQRNADVVLEQTHPSLERQGVIVRSFDRAAREHADLLEPRYGSLLSDDYDWYTAMGAALRSGGAFVYVPKGVQAALPIRLFQWIDRPGVLQAPRTVIVVEAGASATVVEELISDSGEGIAFHAGGTEVFVGEGAKLVYGALEDWGRNIVHYSNHRAQVGRDAELQWIHTVLGGRSVKSNAYYDLSGPGARAYVHGFMFGDQRQHFHLHTLQRHRVEHTTSDLLIKGCLRDRARSVYQGLIQVSEGAQRTDAYQANRNLLLSDTARADSIPGLEILANDVRCTHGATIGTVDAEQLHYLQSRGLPRVEAQRLIVEGFFTPVLDRIPLEQVRDRLRGEIERKLG